jgi:16S rRNA (cytosine967-C5)-methyltransferase
MKPSQSKKPRPDPARVLAFDLITQVNREGAYANIRLPQLLGKTDLPLREKAFATELSYGTLRMQGKYDFAIAKKIDRPFEEIDAKIIDLLRLGCHQVYYMRVPTHAAVSETVELARKVVGESKASYVNAILRTLTRDEDVFSEIEDSEAFDLISKLAIKHSHPKWIISSYFDALKDWEKVEELLAFNNIPASAHLVAWTGKSTRENLLVTGGSSLPFTSHGIVAATQPNDYPDIRNRNAGVQDFGSQLVAEIFLNTGSLAPVGPLKKSESWLDLCAGPGGKAALLFNALVNLDPEIDFLANEPASHRAELVARVIPRKYIASFDGRDSKAIGKNFDRILVDAPCTGLGALRRRPEARWRKSPGDLKELVALQRDLLESGYQMLNPDGILAYSTCSPHLMETKAQVLDLLHRHPDLEILPVDRFHSVPDGSLQSDGTLQLWSHEHNSDSMFLALFHKKS